MVMFANGQFPEASARADYSTLNVFLMKSSVTHTMRTVISNTGGSEQHYTAGAVLHKVHRLLQLVNNRLNYRSMAYFVTLYPISLRESPSIRAASACTPCACSMARSMSFFSISVRVSRKFRSSGNLATQSRNSTFSVGAPTAPVLPKG